MVRVLLDTNFLMIPGTLNVDIIKEVARVCDFKYQLCVLEASIEELNKLAIGATKEAKQAKLALTLIKHAKFKHIAGEGYVDDLIVEVAKEGNLIVATQDRELKKRLKGTPLLVLRGKRYLSLIGYTKPTF